jgi:hypothetical protein
MSILMSAERVYSVDVVLQDGTRSVVQIEAESSSDAYRQAKGRTDVRSVGKVTEGVRYEPSSGSPSGSGSSGGGMIRERRNEHQPRPGSAMPHPQQNPDESPDQRVQQLGFSISGPRVVRDARHVGGERPFAVLAPLAKSVTTAEPAPQAPVAVPPPSIKNNPFVIPPKPVAPPAPAVAPAAKSPAAQTTPASDESAGDTAAGDTSAVEYRIVKSRRKDGLPYLLQRGTWKTQGTKRVFASDWEKGFDVREKAEKHQAWLEQMARENAELANG